ncbi:MAG TPA: DEAD/DEAH box helicase family protein [Thermomicrobiaceae bacterium]|nr:DEAD/DEAH box helicase family protein [Thermomicrobiaceae bacterium]
MAANSAAGAQAALPVQPVGKPILASPYVEPAEHWSFDRDLAEWRRTPGRRPASYWYKTQRTGRAQLSLFAEEERDDIPLINLLREDVTRWRQRNHEGATPITRQLLAHWARADRPRRLFFCQLEAVETIIYLTEILGSGRRPRWRTAVSPEDFATLCRGGMPEFATRLAQAVSPTLVDQPNEADLPSLRRYGCKMATGAGKTVVMAMLIAWSLCNRGRVPGDTRFPAAVLVVCPNLTIKERLQVLRPDSSESYYAAFDLVPATLMPELQKGKVLITNWQRFRPESPHAEGGKTYLVVDKGEESPAAFAQRILGDLADRGPILVLNDEAHHAYRPAPIDERDAKKMSADEKAEREEATVWVSGLDRINQAVGVQFCADLSATPFYLHGSGYIEGAPFPWLVSDFGLVDAIESGIVKIPRLPVSDATGRPEPKYFRLWQNIAGNLQPGEKLPGGKPKPEVVWREAEDALLTLASQWEERFRYIQQATPGQEHTPPVLIVVCDNTDTAELFYRNISGEEVVPALDAGELDGEDEEDAEESRPRPRRGKPKTRTVYGNSRLFPEFANEPGTRHTLRIDSKLLSEIESDGEATREQSAHQLREVLNTIGRAGQPGEQVRCVVSVQMLNEGWDANNVTHILGLRAFTSQLLCEQVVGRGLRRMNYTPDPETGLLTEEYVDVYGVPFSVIPFKGRETKQPEPGDKPKNRVRALDERAALELRFPVVEGYVFDLHRNLIKADIDAMQPTVLQPDQRPTAVFVQPRIGMQEGKPTVSGAFEGVSQDRHAYYESVHPQTIAFEIARTLVGRLSEGAANDRLKKLLVARNQLFPQVYRLVDAYIRAKVVLNGCEPAELGLQVYAEQVVERLTAAIEPNDEAGEPPLLPLLNRYKPIGSTDGVDFITTRPCFGTRKSHINQVVLDTGTWEQSATFRLEQSRVVSCYARSDGMEFVIPYDYLGVLHHYQPDFLVKLSSGITLVLEIKGHEDEQDRAKHEAAGRWIKAVNHWGQLGRWRFHVCKNPQLLERELAWLVERDAELPGAAAGV